MGDLARELLAELKALRKGRGVNQADIRRETGPLLMALCGVVAKDPPGVVRRKLIERLTAQAEQLPPDLAVSVKAALALSPEVRHPFLQERVGWLAGRLERDGRTARRRMDDGLARLAEQAVTRGPLAAGPIPVTTPATGPAPAGSDYYIEQFSALLRLDRPTPEAIEQRVVVAQADGLTELEALLTLPRDPAADRRSHELDVEVLYGVTIADRERVTDSRFRYRLMLPAPLRAGARHEYGLLFRVPAEQRMRTHYVFTSHRRCDLFDLRIRFDPGQLPDSVWPVAGSYPRDVDDGPAGVSTQLDPAGELHLRFADLMIGRGYGAKWLSGSRYTLTI